MQDLQTKFDLGGIKTEIQVKEEPCNENAITKKIVNDEHLTDRNVLTVKKTNERGKQEMFTCDQCGEVSFRSHMENQKKSEYEVPKKRNDKCKCIYCSNYFMRKTDLQRHLRIHTSVKLFVCTICNKKFTQNWIATISFTQKNSHQESL